MIVHYHRRVIIAIFFLATLSFILTIFYINNRKFKSTYFNTKQFKSDWFKTNCLNNIKKYELEYLDEYLNMFKYSNNEKCNEIYRRFNDMFSIENVYGELYLPNEYKSKVNKWLNNDSSLLDKAEKQKILKLYNKFMNEELIYNSLRGKRPQIKDDMSEKTYTDNLIKTSMNNCDFCENNYKKNTASDIFGRIETKYSYTAANTFKYDKWHSLIVSRNHDTLNLNKNEFIDMFHVANEWFDKVNKLDRSARYAQILWDAMPKSGASQVHTHLQCSMGLKSHYGAVERIKSASKMYYDTFYRDYLDDFILLHEALGLAKEYNQTYLIVNLIPIKEYEVILIDKSGKITNSFLTVMHHTTRIFIDIISKFSFSLGMYLPEYYFDENLASTSKNTLKYTICRVVFRSPVSNLRSDMNGLDLYMSSVIGVDRYEIAKTLFSKLSTKLIQNN